MIKIDEIKDEVLSILITAFDESIEYLKSQFGIELRTYGNFLRIALNNIQPDSLLNLIERVQINRELEIALDNSGGYTSDFLGENSPKLKLIEIINHLQKNPLKLINLIKFLQADNERKTVVAEMNEIDYLIRATHSYRIKFISFSQLKRNPNDYHNIVFYSFNGSKDFDFIYNLKSDIWLVLHSQEYQLYKYQSQRRKHLIEEEVKSADRKSICSISYEPLPDLPIHISHTIEKIVTRLDDLGKRDYENYKEDADILLEEIEDRIIYKITSNRATLFLDSNDTIFTDKGNLIKAYKIEANDKIRIYPKEPLAENLYQVAIETEPEIFKKVEEHATLWKQLINELRDKFGDELLYTKLKESGLRILPATLATYGKGHRKFPMFNNDLRAIFKLYYQQYSDNELDSTVRPILNSKSTYNSTMIVLGRGLKQELCLFLKETKIGEILEKRNFNTNTLQAFIDEYMPIHTIIRKESFCERIENLDETTFQQIAL